MTRVWMLFTVAIGGLACVSLAAQPRQQSAPVAFQTSDRCIACHNRLTTSRGEDVSIGFDWRATLMANSSRDPYWQASVRRETMDHPEASEEIQDTCARCHMPMERYAAKAAGRKAEVFTHLPFKARRDGGSLAEDGVSCSLCHQLSATGLGDPSTFTGKFHVDPPDARGAHHEYGPYAVDPGHTMVMQTSTEGFVPSQSAHVRTSELCAACHTLITETLGPGGQVVGRLPEQVPFQEWLHGDYKDARSCQSCHMPTVSEPVPITRIYGQPRQMARHVFVAANFFIQRMLNRYRDDLDVAAQPHELDAAAGRTEDYLATQAATVALESLGVRDGRLDTTVIVENLGGHKLPTAYPSRRAWIHLTVRDGGGRLVFESGKLNPDGSITGNDNDADKTKFEPHYTTIDAPGQVQIYESILGGTGDEVTTGLLTASQYLKDNRLLPKGFDKRSAEADIAVHGGAADDADFLGGGDRVRYSVDVSRASGPFTVDAELLYQPIGFRWAQNLKDYRQASEPHRFTRYYDEMAGGTAATLARASR
jgi:hypothetical protein